MELLGAVAVWILLLMLLIAAAWSIGAKPRPLLLAGSLITFGVMSWMAWSHFETRRLYDGLLETRNTYDLELSGTGDRTSRIHAVPALKGLQIRAIVLPGGHAIDPHLLDTLNLRARNSTGPIRCALVGPGTLVDLETGDGFGEGDRNWVELTYSVTDANLKALRAVRFEARAPQFIIKSYSVMQGVHGDLALGFAVAAVVGLAGFFSQAIRRVRRPPAIENRESRIENRPRSG